MTSKAQQWSSQRAFILAVTGAAVGLGNIWRFPYMTGENGGSAFLLLYILFVLILGLPVMMAEIMVGRAGRAGPMQSLMNMARENGASPQWRHIATLGAVTLFLILSFYGVVSGWSLAYIGKSISGDFAGQPPNVIGGIFGQFLENVPLLLTCHLIFMVLTMAVVARGVTQGLERLNNLLMPLLYLLLLLLAGYAVTTPGFGEAMKWLFMPNPEAITWKATLDAMGHAFFTLAIGACALMAYGAYMPPEQSLPKAVIAVAILDVGVALLSGIAIFSVVFSHGMEPAGGPGLMFVTLPIAFSDITGGTWLSAAFFVLLLLATWTSSINLAEPMVAMLIDKGWRRGQAAFAVGVAVWAMGVLSALSFNVLSDVFPLQALGGIFAGKTVFDLVSSIPPDIFLPLGGLLIAIFATRVMPASDGRAALGGGEAFYRRWRKITVMISAPLVALVLFVSLLKLWGVF